MAFTPITDEPDYKTINTTNYSITDNCKNKISQAIILTIQFKFSDNHNISYIFDKIKDMLIRELKENKLSNPTSIFNIYINNRFTQQPFILTYDDISLPNEFKLIYDTEIIFNKFLIKTQKLFLSINDASFFGNSRKYNCIELDNLHINFLNIIKNGNKYIINEYKDLIDNRNQLFKRLITMGFSINKIRNTEIAEYLT